MPRLSQDISCTKGTSVNFIVCTLPPFLGVETPTKFSKKKGGGVDRTSTFREGLLGKTEVTFFRGGNNFQTINK